MIIHLGYPCCGSTTFQQLLAHSNVNFIGCDTKQAPGKYFAPELGDFFESTFRFGSNKQFNIKKDDVKNYLKQQKNAVLSYEMFSYRVTPFDLPTDIKLARLTEIVPETAIILVMYRPLRNFLLSSYKAYLLWGYTGDFEEYLDELCVLKDYGWLADLDLENLYGMISDNFANARIILANLEHDQIFPSILDELGVDIAHSGVQINAHNQGVDDGHIENMLAFNRSQKSHKKFLDWHEQHRFLSASGHRSDDKIFHLARYKNAIREYLSDHPTHNFDQNLVNWPKAVIELEKRNKDFLESIEKTKNLKAI